MVLAFGAANLWFNPPASLSPDRNRKCPIPVQTKWCPWQYLGVEGHIGRTPLLRLRRVSELTGCEIPGKAEFMNPGGSVKDRAALGIIEDAGARGLLRPGATIVEGTAGNTGSWLIAKLPVR